MHLPAGVRFGPHEIDSAIVAGGMGEVYRGGLRHPDARPYVHSFRRMLSELYLAKGLR